MISNEEQFIDFIFNDFESINNIPKGWIGVGDDAAIIKINSDEVFFCADALVEDVHFRISYDFEDIGWKSIVSNQSDLAGMGGQPLAFTVNLGINNSISMNQFKRLYKGMDLACKTYGGYLVGGDIVKSEKFFISISTIGNPYLKETAMLRNKAKLGDLVAVTGQIGNASTGFEMLEKNSKKTTSQIDKFLRPIPKLFESKLAVESGIICGMDLSDGLQKDLMRICKASKVKIEVKFEKINYDKSLVIYYGNCLEEKILTSGEDYELILIGEINKLNRIKGKCDLSIIGKVTGDKNPELVFTKNNKKIDLNLESFDHFE